MTNAMQKTTIDNHARAPDAGYQRTDAELAHQRRYEQAETNRHVRISLEITYRVVPTTTRQDKSYIEARAQKTGAWVVVRQIAGGREETSALYYRHSEALASMREGVWRDKMAAKRLGVDLQVVVGTLR